MKKFFIFFVLFVFGLSTSLVFNEAYAKKKKPAGGLTLSLKARDGGTIIYGSVLNSNENELKAKLSKAALTAIRDAGVENVSVTITKLVKQEGETSNIYTLNPSDSVDLFGKFLVINLLASLTDVAGSTYTAGALPEGNYELAIIAGDTTLKGKFEYNPPVVLVGTVDDGSGNCSGGTQQITDVTGGSLSRTVALSSCSYFNEVQAKEVNTKNSKQRKLLHQDIVDPSNNGDVTDTPPADGIDVAISEAVTPSGVFDAAIPLDPESNGGKFNINTDTNDAVDNAVGLILGDV